MIYLLHSDHKIGSAGSNSAEHYLGYCEDSQLWRRMHAHLTGKSRVPIIEAFKSAGGTLYLVRVWPEGGRSLERHLKRLGHFKKHCPVCLGWLPLDRAVSIEVASTLLPTFDPSRSPKPMLKALVSALNGTGASKDGPLVQQVIQAPSTWSGSVAGVSLATPGGPASRVVALMKGLAVRSAGTRQQSYDYGRTAVSDNALESQKRRLSGLLKEPEPSSQLPLDLPDKEGYQL